MNTVAAQKEVSVPLIFDPTRDAFRPLLEAHRAEIESIKRRTFKFGPTERHQLDVYYPPAESQTTGGKCPVLFFFYGGGFVGGTRAFPPPYDLAYVNLGAFFAKRGILTVIPDYRLVPDVKFPEPVEDVRDAIAWCVANVDTIANEDTVAIDFKSLFAMSHSAGTVHLSTALLYPGLLPSDLRSRFRGIILKGGVYRFSPDTKLADPAALVDLFGSWDNVQANTPLTLLEHAPRDIIDNFPDTIMLASEREPDGLIASNEIFAEALRAKLGKDVPFFINKGHNHISPDWALFSGEGEEWAEEVTQWINMKYASK